MTTGLEAPPASARRDQSLWLCALVAAFVVVGWVLFRHYAFPHVADRLFEWDPMSRWLWVYDLVGTLLLCLPYAVVLLLWGRGPARAGAGAAVALATGLYMWGLDEVFSNLVWVNGHPSALELRTYTWAHLLVVATLVPLAWGLARRTGRAWVVGLVVAPVAAAILREMQLRWGWWREHLLPTGAASHWKVQAVVYVAPFVLAALACWALEARGRRTPDVGTSEMGSPEMGSPA